MAAKKKHQRGHNGAVKAAKVDAPVQGPIIPPAPKTGPSINIRMRSQNQIEGIRKAAARAKLSMNTWMVEVLDRASVAQ